MLLIYIQNFWWPPLFSLWAGTVFCYHVYEYKNMMEHLMCVETLRFEDYHLKRSTFSILCFAHQFQLALMSTAKNQIKVCRFFAKLSSLCVTVVTSCKRVPCFKKWHAINISDTIVVKEIRKDCGLNQEQSLWHPGETRWKLILFLFVECLICTIKLSKFLKLLWKMGL